MEVGHASKPWFGRNPLNIGVKQWSMAMQALKIQSSYVSPWTNSKSHRNPVHALWGWDLWEESVKYLTSYITIPAVFGQNYQLILKGHTQISQVVYAYMINIFRGLKLPICSLWSSWCVDPLSLHVNTQVRRQGGFEGVCSNPPFGLQKILYVPLNCTF